MNKRGMDAVIATVLLIAITIALIAAVYVFVVPWLQGMMGESKSCFDARVNIEKACQGTNTTGVPYFQIAVSRGSEDFKLGKVIVITTNNTGSKTWTLTTTDVLPAKYEEKTYTTGSATLFALNSTKVRIVPVLEDGTECGDIPVEKAVTAC